jgi:hypothetical protein
MYRVSERYSKWIIQLQLCFKGKRRSQLYKHQSNIWRLLLSWMWCYSFYQTACRKSSHPHLFHFIIYSQCTSASFINSWIGILATWRLENCITSREFLLGVQASHRELGKCTHRSDFAVGCTVQGSDPIRCKRFVSSLECPDQLQNPSTLLCCGYWEPFSQGQSDWGMSLTTSSI